MASTQTDRPRDAALGAESRPDWEREMQVTFDGAELASFFDGFEPLDVAQATDDPDPEHG